MGIESSASAVALLGLPDFVVLAATEVDGELHQLIETTAERVGCPECGVVAVAHGRRPVWVRDLPAGGRPVALRWRKRVWRCADRDCEVRTWTECSEAIAPRASLTERARREACRRVGRDGHSVAQVARDLGVGWSTVMAAVRDHGRPLVEDPQRLAGVVALGLDETAFLRASAAHPTLYVTGFVDLDRARLLDVVAGRSARAVHDWLGGRPPDWRAEIDVVALDPFRGYANGVAAHLPEATVVVDHFHAVRLANAAIDDVRRRVQNETTGHRGRRGDPLYGIRRLLVVAAERLSDRGRARMMAGLAAGDSDGEVAAAYLAKELLREVYGAVDLPHARRRLTAFYSWCAEAEVAELARLATTVSSWQAEVLAYHTTGQSNGPTEAVNLLIEKVRRIGHGFRNFENYRLRLLLRCGVKWQTRPVARIRGRQPRLVA